jgi:type II secretion system protein H
VIMRVRLTNRGTGLARSHRARSIGSSVCRAGFSLIELIVVVMLIGVMVALIVPHMRGTYEDVLLRSAGRKLADAARVAHSQAITVNAAHRIRIDAGSHRYHVERVHLDPDHGPAFVPLRHVPGSEGTFHARISIEVRGAGNPLPIHVSGLSSELLSHDTQMATANPGIVFYPDGTADPAEIHLRDQEGFGLSLRISPVTGRVRTGPIARE